MHLSKAVIIGSGIGGLATAIRLAVKGYQVSVYEKNDYAGGKLAEFNLSEYHFDAGPSLFTQPQQIEELFDLADEPIGNYLTWEPVDTACKYFFENGKVVQAFTDPEKFSDEMKQQLNERPEAVSTYLKNSEKLYTSVGNVFLNGSLHKRSTWLNKKIASALPVVRFIHLFRSLHAFNTKHFSSAEAVQLFNRFATYNGSNPYSAPSMLSLIPSIEHNDGTFYPKGGMISVSKALYKLARAKGVQFHFGSPVERIICHEGKVRGVVVKGNNILADTVISNADVYITHKHLLGNHDLAKKLLKQERSSSAVIFYWGINKEFRQLGLHNILFSKDYKNEFEELFTRGKISSDPTVYINITSKMESGKAPAGKENWFVMVNAPSNTGQNWAVLKHELRENVLNKISRLLGEEIEPLIEVEHISDPVMLEQQTGSYMGSLYGTSSNSRFSAFLRHANFTRSVKGLYFCGGSVHPGGGIPLCLKSAGIVSNLIKADHQ